LKKIPAKLKDKYYNRDEAVKAAAAALK